jgi:hypothetical protein
MNTKPMSADLDVEVLDPRHDPEPAYWAALRARAGLRADWAWDMIGTSAWLARLPLLVAVLHRAGAPVGVATGTYSGLPYHHKRFVPVRGGPLVGVWHVRAPASSALPGWWLDDGLTVRDVVRCRPAIGRGCAGVLLRQVSPEDLTVLPARARLVRPTEPSWALPLHDVGDVTEWIGGLRRKRRAHLRATWRETNADQRIVVDLAAASTADPAEVVHLLRHNENKYRGRLSPLPTATGYLRALMRRDDVLTVTYRDRGTSALLAVGVTLDDPRWPMPRYWSMLPVEQGGVRNAYFHHLTVLVDWAIVNGKQGLLLGKGKSEVKESLGAVPNEQSAVLVVR